MVLDDRFNTHINLIPKTETKDSINNYSPLILWIESLGMSVTPIGPELRSTGKASPSASLPTPEQRRQIMGIPYVFVASCRRFCLHPITRRPYWAC
jgi:hypothetical protein